MDSAAKPDRALGRLRDKSGVTPLQGDADLLRPEIIMNFSLLNDDAIGFVPITLPPPAFFRTRGISLNVASGSLGRQRLLAAWTTRIRAFPKHTTASAWL